MRAGIYVRVSTTQQIDRDSLKTQEERLRLYCKAHNYEVYRNKPYRDEGISAKDTKRPAFEKLRQDIETGKIQVAVVTRLDRITRSLKDLIELMEFLQEHETKIVSLTENIDTTGPMGRFVLNLLGSVAQLEREIDSERVSADMHHRASMGKWNGGVVPLGYITRGKLLRELKEKGVKEDEALNKANKLTPEKGRLYVLKQDAGLVRKIYQLYLECRSLRKATHELNRQGIRTRHGETWATPSIRRILTNPTYIGKIWYGKRRTDILTGRLSQVKPKLWKVVKGEHEAIVSEKIFNEAGKVLKSRFLKPSRASRTYLLTGLVKCGRCHGGMYGYTYRKKQKGERVSYFYYRCKNSIQKGTSVCKGLIVRGNELEKAVIDRILGISKDKKFLQDKELMLKTLHKEVKPSKPGIEEEKKKLVLEEQKIAQKRNTLLEKLESRVIDDAIFLERFDLLKKQLDAVRNKLAEIASKGETIDLQRIALQIGFDELSNLPETWKYLDDKEKLEKLQSIVNQIIVDLHDRKLKIRIELFLDRIDREQAHRRRSTGTARAGSLPLCPTGLSLRLSYSSEKRMSLHSPSNPEVPIPDIRAAPGQDRYPSGSALSEF